MEKRYWTGSPGELDSFGKRIGKVFYDAATREGPWAIMNELSWFSHGRGKLGTGCGQKYEKQGDGRWLKIEG